MRKESANRLKGQRVIRTVFLITVLFCTLVNADADKDRVHLVTANLLPYSIQSSTQSGFMVELVEEIERRIGSDRQIKFLPWGRAQALAKSNANHIIFPLTRTPEREDSYLWAIKVAPIEMAFITLGGSPLSLSQARKLNTVSVQQNTPFEAFLKSEGFENLERLSDPASQHVHLLKLNRSQAWFTARDLANYALRDQVLQSRFVFSENMYISDVYIATSKKFPPDVASIYRKTFDEILKDGSFDAIMQRYRRH